VTSEIRSLTGLRFVAIWGAVLGELWFLHEALVRDQFPGHGGVFNQLAQCGELFADVFFCLSGLVLTYRYGASMGERLVGARLSTFVVARAARIFPAYLLCLVIVFALLVIGQLARDVVLHDDLQTGNLVRQALLVQAWPEADPYQLSWMQPTWVVSAIVLGSVAFPFLILPVYRAAEVISSRGRLVIACLIPGPIAVLVLNDGGVRGDYMWALRLFCFFVSGMLLATTMSRPTVDGDRAHPLGVAADHRSWTIPLVVVLAVVGLVAVVQVAVSDLPVYAVLLFGVVPVVGVAAMSHPVTESILGNELLVRGGRLAYCFSMTQSIALIALAIAVPERWATHHVGVYSAFVGLGIAVAWFAAYLLSTRVEVPARVALTTPLPGTEVRGAIADQG
jgi:peptidoglycan/LPS O-acetylase OafA/YrhL